MCLGRAVLSGIEEAVENEGAGGGAVGEIVVGARLSDDDGRQIEVWNQQRRRLGGVLLGDPPAAAVGRGPGRRRRRVDVVAAAVVRRRRGLVDRPGHGRRRLRRRSDRDAASLEHGRRGPVQRPAAGRAAAGAPVAVGRHEGGQRRRAGGAAGAGARQQRPSAEPAHRHGDEQRQGRDRRQPGRRVDLLIYVRWTSRDNRVTHCKC